MPTTTITTTAPQAARVAVAFGKRLGLGRNATEPEVKQQLVRFLIDVVQEQEEATARAAAVVGITPIAPT